MGVCGSAMSFFYVSAEAVRSLQVRQRSGSGSPECRPVEIESLRAPASDVLRQLLVAVVVKLELVAAKPVELDQHLREQARCEAAVLLNCEAAEPLETVVPLQRHQIDEVTGLGPPEDREHLVDGELLSAEQWCGSSRLRREQSRIGSQVDLGAIVRALDDESGESGTDLNPLDAEP